MENKKKLALGVIIDTLSNYFYYDRKHDEDLSVGDMQTLIEDGVLTEEEIINKFSEDIKEIIRVNFAKKVCQ